jgi:HAD superfamily hydrolase (TIGR01509 family)
MKLFDAVIFDMDGVIVDSEPLHERAFLEVFGELGLREKHGLDFTDYYGRSDEAVWRDFFERHQPNATRDQLVTRKRERFLHLLRAEEPLFEGLLELLDALHPRYPLAIASGSAHPVIDGVLALRGLRRYFQAVVSSQDVSAEKPAPDVFLRAAHLLGVSPLRCCVIEDSVAGVEGARAAGMTAIGITNSLPADRLTAAHHVVGTYREIYSLLLRPDACCTA